MRILVLYLSIHEPVRFTIYQHLFAFKRYIKEVEFIYHEIGTPLLDKFDSIDGVILHYTLLSLKWNNEQWIKICQNLQRLAKLPCTKVAIPQDEYWYSKRLCQLFKNIGLDAIFTCALPGDHRVLYPKDLCGVEHIETIFTGYIDEELASTLENRIPFHTDRSIDIGYRARKLPYFYGSHSQLKRIIADKLLKVLSQENLIYDISTEDHHTLYGYHWYDFLYQCRTTLGCLGGASLHDPTGEIANKTKAYLSHHPSATFEDTERNCFPNLDGNLKLKVLGPRHFDCAITKTCQVLLEGDYQNVFKPDLHYIEIKQDFRNIDEVIDRIRDRKYCQMLAEQTYQDVVLSKKYTYKEFARKIVYFIKHGSPC